MSNLVSRLDANRSVAAQEKPRGTGLGATMTAILEGRREKTIMMNGIRRSSVPQAHSDGCIVGVCPDRPVRLTPRQRFKLLRTGAVPMSLVEEVRLLEFGVLLWSGFRPTPKELGLLAERICAVPGSTDRVAS